MFGEAAEQETLPAFRCFAQNRQMVYTEAYTSTFLDSIRQGGSSA